MSSTAVSANATRRWGAGTAAIARLLIAADRPLTGVAIAAAVGVTQPRASQVLTQFRRHGVVQVTADGYVAVAAPLLELYGRRSRPALTEPESYWYSTRSLYQQARQLMQRADDCAASIAFSADLGPDLLAPWRHPTVAIVYSDRSPSTVAMDFVPAEGRADASLIIRWTSDTTLLTPAPPWPAELDGVPLADPVQQWNDLHELGGDDRREAADRLRDAIIRRTLPRTA